MYRIIPTKELTHLHSDLLKNGWCVIRNYINNHDSLSLVNRLEDIYDSHWSSKNLSIKAAPLGLQNLIKDDRMVNNIFYFDEQFVSLATTGSHLDIIGNFLDDPYYGLLPEGDHNFILSQLNARDGKNPLPFHVDVRLQVPGTKTWSMQGFLSLNNLTKNNGALRVRSCSHLLSEMPDSTKNYIDSEILDTEPGDMILFFSNLHHATSPNINSQSGWTALFTYRAWWCKQQFDIWSLISKKNYLLSNQQKLLLGACSIPSQDPFTSSSARCGYEIFSPE